MHKSVMQIFYSLSDDSGQGLGFRVSDDSGRVYRSCESLESVVNTGFASSASSQRVGLETD